MKKTLIILTASLMAALDSNATSVVHVDLNLGDLYGVGYSSAFFNNYYNSLDGVSSFRVSTPPASEVDLYLSYPRFSTFNVGDANTIENYILGGGRVVIFAEHNGSGGTGSSSSNTALQMIGSSLRFDGAPSIDGGGHQNSIDGQILNSPFMKGVNTLNYAAADSISGGTPIFLASDLSSPLISYEQMGLGIIFAVGDTNFVDTLNSGSSDNYRFFSNLISVPEPATSALICISIFLFSSNRRRKNQSE